MRMTPLQSGQFKGVKEVLARIDAKSATAKTKAGRARIEPGRGPPSERRYLD
jgi:hypothetical protein